MNKSLITSSLFTMALCATASASTFTVSGAGGAIPDTVGGTWQTTLPTAPFVSTVAVANPVTSVTSVVITGLTHTWVGDLQAVLVDPSGAGHNLFHRHLFTTAGFGNSGDFAVPGQTITLIDTGAAWPAVAGNIPTGSYVTYAGTWAGGLGIANGPLAPITGPAGTWSLKIYDWAGGDVGTLTGWTLNGTDLSGPVAFCEPGVAGVLACQCGNPNGAGVGCANTGSSGASIAFAGTADLATDATDPGVFSLTGNSMLSGGSCIILQGDGLAAGGSVTFGAGIRCAGGQLFRLYVKPIAAGSATGPVAGDRSISNRSSDLGTVITPGSTRYYQVYYRDPGQANPGLPCPLNDTFNITTGLTVVWS